MATAQKRQGIGGTLSNDHNAASDENTWWADFCQAIGQGAADAGAGVPLNNGGEARLPVDQPPELFQMRSPANSSAPR